MSSSEQSINIPQLVIIILLGGLAVRYFFFSTRSMSTAQARSTNAASNLRAREADVERIQQMFPQVPRRTIMWDLQRNGGNVVATTERILSGRGLEAPPQSFQPPLPVPALSSTSSATSSSSENRAHQPNLITRYNLSAKIAEEKNRQAKGSEKEDATSSKPCQAWSQNKAERQALLQRRREEMILAARRKMETKVKAEAAQG